MEVLKSIDVRQKEFQVELIVFGQALINIKMNTLREEIFAGINFREFFFRTFRGN